MNIEKIEHAIKCILMDENLDIITFRIVKARKHHRSTIGGQIIKPGTEYLRIFCLYDFKGITLKLHKETIGLFFKYYSRYDLFLWQGGEVMKKHGLMECPVCKKDFVPAPEHAWQIETNKLVCSYKCMRKWEINKHFKRRIDTDYGKKLRKVK